MSAIQTLRHNDAFHMHVEAFDLRNVYLEVRNTRFVTAFALREPLAAWKELPKHTVEPTKHSA